MRAIPVVNHLIRVGNREKADDLTPLKIQKLLFFLHGWYLAVTGEELIDERFQAWQYGPVVPEVYEALRNYGSLPVNDYVQEWDEDAGAFKSYFVNIKTRPEFPAILDRVWREYSKFSATQLSTLTHQKNSPWAKTSHRATISNEMIRSYFLDQVSQKKHKLRPEHNA